MGKIFTAAIVGSRSKEVALLVKKYGLKLEAEKPDIVISYGGDGTLMKAEQQYPGLPKLVLRASSICKKCSPYPNEKVLELFQKGKYRMGRMMKIEARFGAQKIIGLNEINIHSDNPRHAIRYRYSINGIEHPHEVVGDGAVIATPFGSSAYYRSITKSTFQKGIGFAFNNSTEPFDHIILNENSEIEITISRGPAIVFADNQKQALKLQEGDLVRIKKSPQEARILIF